jgi:murein DD-endopeptidase MepM/ murein hydrolase activator NlpD
MAISGIKAALFGLCLLPFFSTEAAENGLTFIYKARTLQPGEVLLIEARTARPLKSLQAEAFDRKFPAFVPKGGQAWTALVGIDLDTSPGNYPLTLTGTDVDGKHLAVQKTLRVIAKKFPTRTLAVDEKFVSPPKEVLARIEKESAEVNAIFTAVTPEKFWSGQFRVPVPGKVISAFGKRNLYNGKPRSPHTGVDFRGATGTPVRAPNAGRIVLAQELYYSGNTVIIDHGLGLYSYMGHMSAILVALGDKVVRGQRVGKVGATGRVTGPHLHWTVRLNTARVNPLSLIRILKSPR